MKKTLQAAALILMAASVVYAAAHSSNARAMTCKKEWEGVLEKKQVNEAKHHYAEKHGVEKGMSESAYR